MKEPTGLSYLVRIHSRLPRCRACTPTARRITAPVRLAQARAGRADPESPRGSTPPPPVPEARRRAARRIEAESRDFKRNATASQRAPNGPTLRQTIRPHSDTPPVTANEKTARPVGSTERLCCDPLIHEVYSQRSNQFRSVMMEHG